MIKGFTFSMVAAAMAAFTVNAKTISPSEALSKVSDRIPAAVSAKGMKSTMSTGSSAMALVRTEQKDGEPTVYTFSSPANGFVCVAANDNVDDMLLGYSENGSFDAENMSPAMTWLLGELSEVVAEASSADDSYVVTPDWFVDIDPLLDTRWGQTSYYNHYTPVINGAHTPTGCVATALAQCMAKYRWPEQPTGKPSYTWSYGSTKETLALDFDTISFNWNNIVDRPWAQPMKPEYTAEMSKLLSCVGIACKVKYGPGATSGNFLTASKALIDYFGYGQSTCYIERAYFKFNEWQTILYNELAAGRPVPYCGSSTNEGHAFVCDGYREGGYFHINWGWDGANNGYFRLAALTPDNEYRAIAQAGYNMNQGMIIGMAPEYEGLPKAIHLRADGNFKTKAKSYTRSASSNVIFQGENGIFSMSNATVTVTLGVKLVDSKGNTTYVPASASRTFPRMSATQTYQISTECFPTTDGTYDVYPVYRDENGEWGDIHIKMSANRSLKLTIKGKSLKFSEPNSVPQLSIDEMYLVSPLFIDQKYSFKASISNFGEEFHDMVYPVVLRNDSIVGKSNPMCLNVLEGSTENAQWVGTIKPLSGMTLTPGYYQLGLARYTNSNYELLGETIEVNMRAASKDQMMISSAVAVDGNYGSFTNDYNPVTLNSTTADCSIDIECIQGYFGQNVTLRVFKLDGTKVFVTEPSFVGIEGGESSTIHTEIDINALEAGTIYKVLPYAGTTGVMSDTPAYITVGERGTTSISSVTSDNTGLYPSMTSDYTTVNAASEIKDIKVYSVSGQLAAADINYDDTQATIGVGRLQQGHYLVQVTTVDGQSAVHRLIKR